MDTIKGSPLGTAAQRDASIVAVLREAIRQRLLPPGMPLVQSALAEALGVSRIPVREALQFLASEGLVTSTDEGVKVTVLTAAEVDELWTLRGLLEPAMAEAIARNVGPRDLEELGQLVAAMDEADGDQWLDLNYHFHTTLYRVARLPHFASAATRVLTLIEPHTRVSVLGLQAREIAQREHHEILAAIAERDGARLRGLLEPHSFRPRQELVDWAGGKADSVASVNAISMAARSFVGRLLADGAPAAEGRAAR